MNKRNFIIEKLSKDTDRSFTKEETQMADGRQTWENKVNFKSNKRSANEITTVPIK